jgi:hypothetical protein
MLTHLDRTCERAEQHMTVAILHSLLSIGKSIDATREARGLFCMPITWKRGEASIAQLYIPQNPVVIDLRRVQMTQCLCSDVARFEPTVPRPAVHLLPARSWPIHRRLRIAIPVSGVVKTERNDMEQKNRRQAVGTVAPMPEILTSRVPSSNSAARQQPAGLDAFINVIIIDHCANRQSVRNERKGRTPSNLESSVGRPRAK